MKKICMIVQKYYYQDVRVRRYVESLVNTGVAVDVICPTPDIDMDFEAQDQIRIYLIPIRHIERNKLGQILEFLLSFILYFIKLSILHFRNRYNAIHVHNIPDFLVFSAIIPKMMGTPLILDIHDPMPEVFLSKFGEQSNKLILRLIKLQERISCSLADKVITVNSICEMNLKSRGIPSEKIVIIHNYPNPIVFDRKLYSKENLSSKKYFTLIFPGTLAPRYGLETVIRAIPQLKKKIPEIRLLVYSQNTPYRDELCQLADQLEVLSHVEFKPLIPHTEVPRQLVAADVGIYPAVNDIHMSLATPTKVLEYSAMGIPIVSSRLNMVEELFGDSTIMFFESQNVSQFTKCVLELYQNPTLRKKLTQNAYQKFIQKFSWDREFQVYLKMLNRLLLKSN